MLNDIQKTLWAAADKLRANMDAAEYKHIVLGLIFVKYISDTFAASPPTLSRAISTRIYAPTSSSPIRRSTSATGGMAAWKATRAGNLARRRKATPTMPGCSTCSTTSSPAVAPASCWRMVQ